MDAEQIRSMIEASMRPGPEGPGCRSWLLVSLTEPIGFNEAGAGRPPDAQTES